MPKNNVFFPCESITLGCHRRVCKSEDTRDRERVIASTQENTSLPTRKGHRQKARTKIFWHTLKYFDRVASKIVMSLWVPLPLPFTLSFHFFVLFWPIKSLFFTKQVNLASAILRTITEVLESKARMGEPSIVSAQVQPRRAVQEVEELDIHNVFKL